MVCGRARKRFAAAVLLPFRLFGVRETTTNAVKTTQGKGEGIRNQRPRRGNGRQTLAAAHLVLGEVLASSGGRTVGLLGAAGGAKAGQKAVSSA